MTDQELAALGPGDAVEYWDATQGVWYPAFVLHPPDKWMSRPKVRVRRRGRTPAGRAPRTLLLGAEYLRPPKAEDAVAHVYADYLEERGYPEAALELWKAVPLGPPDFPAQTAK